MSSNIQIPKICAYCGKHFIAKTTVTRYCSHQCNRRHYKAVKRAEKIQQSLETYDLNPEREITPVRNTVGSKEFLSIQETTELLGVSRWTIQRLIRKGLLKSAKVGRRTIIRRSDIDELFS